MEQVQNQSASTEAVVRPITSCRSTRVRVAEESDLDFLVSETKEFAKAYGTTKDLYPGEELAGQGLQVMLSQHLFLICEIKGERTGFIAGYHCPHPFNPNLKLLAESFWWIKPEYRQGRSAYLLLSHFVTFGRKYADWILFTLEHNSLLKPESLERFGFKRHESGFILET